jgi:transposase
MSIYVGMDVHRKRSQVAVVDDAGVQQRNRNVANDPAQLVPILGALPPGTPVAFEAAYGWGWLVDLLEELELEPHLVHPSRCKAIASARLKDDKVDAATLAQLLRADLLPEAWIAPQQVRDLRALLRHRASLVRLSTAAKNRIHAVLADRGIGQQTGLWTGTGRVWLAGLELPPTPRAIVEDYLVKGAQRGVDAARRYSWRRPPSRSRRCTTPWSSSPRMVSWAGGSGGCSSSARWGRWRL